MYKVKHDLILESKYLMLVFGYESKTDKGEKKKEKKRRRRRRREKKGKKKFKKDQRYGLLWVYMDFYGWG